ncbi:regucalcin-like [Athalia rosae]|uniref:regucalcin-like n=1 Tax=Athalia rosae TaxID=37344 RepID=UPI00203494A7|nr:regucalcin-like [Athalia rosae]XP_048504706.1 regucalcin-like [Athalia rosae]XP_048504707.1 regucalcin-like [Athalia rosae]
MAPNVEIVCDEKLDLGEGPHWDHKGGVLYYVDIFESSVFKYDPSTKKVNRVVVDKQNKTPVGFVIPVADTNNKFVIGYRNELAILTWDGISPDPTNVEVLVGVEPGTTNRFNDGKADPRGRLWAGTKAKYHPGEPEVRSGALYSLSKDGKTVKVHATDIGISNGLAWSSDFKTFYYIDSFNRAVDAFDYDIDSGETTNRRTVFDLIKNNVEGFPDGMTIDVEDKLWVATFGGSAIHRVDPVTGSLLQSVSLPAAKITSVAWGGPKLDELYVTSASRFDTEENRHAGRLFKVTGLGTSGGPGVPVKL